MQKTGNDWLTTTDDEINRGFRRICIIVFIAIVCMLLSFHLVNAATNSKEQNFTQLLSASSLSATTSFSTTDAGFLSVVSLHFSAAPANAETIKVYRDSRAGANFDTLIASYTTIAGTTTDVSILVGNAIPIADTDQVRVTCTNVSAATTVYLSVVLDTAPRGSGGIAVYDNGALKISGLLHDYHWHTGDVLPAANQELGSYYFDFASLLAPASPAAGTRRVYVDSVTGKLSVRTNAGVTASLEEAGHTVEDEGIPVAVESTLNFTGPGVTCTDSGGKTVCDVPTPPSGGDNLTANAVSLTDPNFNDITPVAPVDGVNVRWQSNTAAPDQVSANVPFATALLSGAISTAAQTLAGAKILTDTATLDNQKALRWREATANGTNYVSFAAPATLASDRTCVLQDGAAPIPDSCVGNGVDDAGSGSASGIELTASFNDAGQDSVETVVTGQGWVLSTSSIVCNVTGAATADRADGDEDALIEGMQSIVHTRVVATGFTVETKARDGNAHGDYIVHCTAV